MAKGDYFVLRPSSLVFYKNVTIIISKCHKLPAILLQGGSFVLLCTWKDKRMKETLMKKRYLFVAVALLAAGLVFTGCDLLNPDGIAGDEEMFPIIGNDDEGKVVRIEFFVKKDVMRPQRDDRYIIKLDNNQVSSGKIDVIGLTAPQKVIFIPNTGDRFEASLDIANRSMSFPGGILTSAGTIIMAYRDTGNVPKSDLAWVDPPNGDLDDIEITLSVGESVTLKVAARSKGNGGGAPYYQWYRSAQNSTTFTPIQGATANSYAVPTFAVGTFTYCAKVANASGDFLTSKKKVVKVVASTEIVVGNSSGMTPLHNLRDAINTLLATNSNNGMDYSVIFAIDLPYPLFIGDDFPGTGKLTIKSRVPFTKGIYITRSNVELNGLNINIDNIVNAALYLPQNQSALTSPIWPCAVLISDRYFWASEHDDAKDNTKYNAYETSDSRVRSASIVNCNIVFRAAMANSDEGAITGICVDPYTAGRNPDTRIKVRGTSIDVFRTNGGNAQCFMGNNTDFVNNNFISSDKVADIQFLLKLNYLDANTTVAPFPAEAVTFANNRFDSTAYKVFEIRANLARTMKGYFPAFGKTALESIKGVCATFGEDDHQFGELPSQYRWLIENLYAQLINPVSKAVLLVDYYPDPPTAPSTTLPSDYPDPPEYKRECYVMMTRDNIKPNLPRPDPSSWPKPASVTP